VGAGVGTGAGVETGAGAVVGIGVGLGTGAGVDWSGVLGFRAGSGVGQEQRAQKPRAEQERERIRRVEGSGWRLGAGGDREH
jgi:hypothetical protein